jgi:glutaminyl-tRNA synthetase
MNFSLAFEKLGVAEKHRRTAFRYDDTNSEAESTEYIDSIRRDMEWLGWTPEGVH